MLDIDDNVLASSFQQDFRTNAGLICYPVTLFQWLVFSGKFKVLLKENFETDVILRHNLVAGQQVFWSELPMVRAPIINNLDSGAVLLLTQPQSGSTGIALAANDIDTAKNILSEAKKLFPPIAVSENQTVPILFWQSAEIGSQAIVRKLSVVGWDQVASNYTGETRNDLTSLMVGFDPAKRHGRLMLWHGEPGTGKTYAIRALAWAWKKWCRFEYVTDPERLFGDAGYLMQVLLSPECPDGSDDRWRLLIIEDSGELLTMDAKSVVGQGLSRLLGLADGLLGQGMRVLVLITTNEDLGKFHRALMRPGRCLSEIEFARFGPDEGSQWLLAAGCDRRTDAPKTLSELYAMVTGDLSNSNLPQIGFRP
jgi:hypothetical protein